MNDGKKRKPQKHQNKTAFKIQFNPLALEIHKKVSFKGYSICHQDYVNDALNKSNGNLILINIKKWQNLLNAIIAIKRMFLEHIWKLVNFVIKNKMFAQNAYKI